MCFVWGGGGGGGGGGALKTGSLGSSEKMWVFSKVAKKAWWIHFEKRYSKGKYFVFLINRRCLNFEYFLSTSYPESNL